MSGGRYFWAGAIAISAVCILLMEVSLNRCFAGDPAKSFEDLFGADAKKAWSSRNTKDAADFAVKLLETAQKLGDDPGLKEYMLNKACDFAMKDPSGFATAQQAVEMLIADFAGKKGVYTDKLLGLYQTQYDRARGAEKTAAGEEYAGRLIARGDELLEPPQVEPATTGPASPPAGPQINVEAVNAAIKVYRQAQAVAGAVRSSDLTAQINQKIADANAQLDLKRRYDDLVGRYSAKPDDAVTAKALTLLCLLDLDDPALASKYSATSGDEALKIYVPLAAKPVGELPEPVCLELANWYKALAGTASSQQAKINAFSRCKSYITQFLALHDKSDADQIRAQKIMDEVGAQLAKLDPAGTGGTSSKKVRLNLPQKLGIIWKYEGPATLLYGVMLSPDCKKLMMHYKGGYLLFDVETRKELFKHDCFAMAEAFTADSKVFLLGTANPLSAFDIKTGKPLIKDAASTLWANCTPCFSSDGQYCFGFLNTPKELEVVEVATGKKVKKIPLEAKGTVRNPAAAMSPDGRQVMVAGIDEGEAAGKQRFCKIFDLESGKITQTLPCFQETDFGEFRVAFLSDGKRAVGCKSRTGIQIWDVRNGKVLWEFKKEKPGYAITPDGKRLAMTDYHSIEVMDVASGKVLHKISPDEGKGESYHLPGSLCFTPDGQYLFCGYNTYKDKELKNCGIFLVGIGQ